MYYFYISYRSRWIVYQIEYALIESVMSVRQASAHAHQCLFYHLWWLKLSNDLVKPSEELLFWCDVNTRRCDLAVNGRNSFVIRLARNVISHPILGTVSNVEYQSSGYNPPIRVCLWGDYAWLLYSQRPTDFQRSRPSRLMSPVCWFKRGTVSRSTIHGTQAWL